MASSTDMTYIPLQESESVSENMEIDESSQVASTDRLEDGRQRSFMNASPKILQGGVISPPELNCIEASEIYPDTGRWQTQRESSNVLKTYPWIVLSFVDKGKLSENKIREFLLQLNKVHPSSGGFESGQFLGVQIFGAQGFVYEALQREDVRSAKFAIILLEGKTKIYDEIKFTDTYNLELICQCVTVDKIYNLNKGMARSICSSITAKLGDLSYKFTKAIKLFSRPIIIFGNAFSSVKNARIASIVGSLDAYPSRYQVSCRIQYTQYDFIEHLEDMVKTILNSFYDYTTGLYPEKIIFFKRGIPGLKSFMHEFNSIQKACEDTIGRNVPMTFILVTRTKLNDTNSKCATGIENTPLVTTNITDYGNLSSRIITKYDINFVQHDRPTSFAVIHDDNKFNEDELKELTDHMCNADVGNTCLTIPAPMRYAKNAAEYAVKYADYLLGKREEETPLPDSVVDAIHNMERNKNHMFFL